MRRLVPFPDEVGSLCDAELLDLNVLVSTDVARGPDDTATVEVRARYATSSRLHQVREFYDAEFARAGARSAPTNAPPLAETEADSAMVLTDGTRYDMSVTPADGYRIVKVSAKYCGFDPHPIFDRFARWHNGTAPVAVDQPTALEISTFANGRRPETLVLYRTEYECPSTPWSVRRAQVDNFFRALGWSYNEPREGIMFIQDGLFDAETHVSGDETGSNVAFVGEFQLR